MTETQPNNLINHEFLKCSPISTRLSVNISKGNIENGKANARQMDKILGYAKELELLSKDNMSDDEILAYTERFDQILAELRKMKITNPKTMSRLIEIALNTSNRGRKKDYSRYTRNLLNLLYRMNREAFLQNFAKNCRISEKKSA